MVSTLKYYTGSVWTAKPLKYWTGSAWTTKQLKYWNGSAWIGASAAGPYADNFDRANANLEASPVDEFQQSLGRYLHRHKSMRQSIPA